MEELKNLTNCGAGWAEERAQLAIDFAEQHANGELSDSEYKELLEDLIRTDVLDEEADDLATKSALVTGVMGLLQVV